MKINKLFLLLMLLCTAPFCGAQTLLSPARIQWSEITGSGAPTSTCQAVEPIPSFSDAALGWSYIDSVTGNTWACLYNGTSYAWRQTSAGAVNGSVDLIQNPLVEELPNNTANGAVLNTLVCMSSSGTAQPCTTSSTQWTGVAVGGSLGTSSGNVKLARTGQTSLILDDSSTVGDYVQISSTTGGYGHDTGAKTYPTSGAILGRVVTNNTGAGTAAIVNLYSPGISGSGGSGLPTGTALNYVGYNALGVGIAIDPTQGGSVSAVAPITAVTVPTPSVGILNSGLTFSTYHPHGDSITNGTVSATCTNSASTCYVWQIANRLGISTVTNDAVIGDQAPDLVRHVFNDENPTTSDGTLRTMMIGLNSANNIGLGGYVENETQANIAAITWLAIPASNKSLGSAQTPATGWSADTTFADAPGLTTTTYNAPQTFTISYVANTTYTAINPHMYMWYRRFDSGAGATFTVAGGASTIIANSNSTFPIATSNGATDSIASIDLGPVSGGTGTKTYTVTGVTAAGGTISILGVGYPTPGATTPALWVGGVSRNLFNINSLQTSTYNRNQKNNVSNLQTVGFSNINFVDVRSYWLNNLSDMLGSSTNNDTKHPNTQGHIEIADAFLGSTASPTIDPVASPTVGQLRTITSLTNCGLSSTDEYVLFNTGSTSGTCTLPAADVTNVPKTIRLQMVGTGQVQLVAPYTGINGSAVGAILTSNQALQIEADYKASTSLRWNAYIQDPSIWSTCKVVSPPYQILITDACLVNGGSGGVYTWPTASLTSKEYAIINTGSGNDTFSGGSGSGSTAVIYPGNAGLFIARTSTLYDTIMSGTGQGGFLNITAPTTNYTVLSTDAYIRPTYVGASNVTLTLPTTFPSGKVLTVENINTSTGLLVFTGASSGNANNLKVAPGQRAQLTTGASGAWTGVVLSPTANGSSESHTASNSASLNFTTCITSANTNYNLVFTNLIPAVTNNTIQLQVSTNNGSTYDITSGDYASGVYFWVISNPTTIVNGGSTSIPIANDIANDSTHGGISGTITLYNPASTTSAQAFGGSILSYLTTNGTWGREDLTGFYTPSSLQAYNAIRVTAGSGNLTSGTVACYPIAN